MRWNLRFLLTTLTLTMVVISPAHAQTPEPPITKHTAPYWDAVYWNNTSLAGDPAAITQETDLDHDWGAGSPHSKVNADRFSARWTRYIDVSAGTYRFTATSDDGIRVYVDDKLIIDQWYDHPPQTFTADVSLTADHHLVKVEYYENRGGAVAKVSWETTPTSSSVWHGEYYDNRWFRGTPLQQDVDAIDFDWGYGSPAPSIPSDSFSVRWTRVAYFSAGQYRFTASSDDGIRVYVDRQLVIDGGWYDHPTRTFVGDVTLREGNQQVMVEYYENTGMATAKVTWGPVPTTTDVWRGEYFDNPSLSSAPRLTLKDARIDFDWGYRSPAREIPNDRFSVRWTREVTFEPGTYRFTATTDDGVRLWVNEHLLIDNWRDQAFTARSGTIYLEGNVPLKMEYYENGGVAAARLTWAREGENPSPPPDGVIVDDTDPGFVKGGTSYGWGTAAEGHGGHLTWARNKNWLIRYQYPGYNWGRWYPSLAPGRYEVFVYVPERYTTSAEARYWVKHRDGLTLRVVDQSANGNRWVSLGTYWFNGDGEDRVSLATPTHEPNRSRLLAFDAVKWVAR